MTNAFATAQRLEECLQLMKRVCGSRWDEKAEPIRKEIRKAMARAHTTNVLQAVLPYAKQLDADGNSPVMLIAVAAEMAKGEAK